VASLFLYSLLLIDVGMFKDRAVAMGKPHCNRSIRTLLVINLVWDFILVLISVQFRVNPWLVFYLILLPWLNPTAAMNRPWF